MASNGRRAHGESSFLGRVADRLLARPWVVLAAALVVQTALFFAIQRDLSTADPLYYARIVLAALAGDAALDRLRSAPWRLALAAAFAIFLFYPHVNSLRKKVFAFLPETEAYAALRAEVASTTDLVVLVCGDFRCPMFTDLHFGFEAPANLAVVHAPDFAVAPPPERARVRLLVRLVRSGGVGRDVARRADELGLRRILWHPDVRLYDAEDGARLRAALAKP